MIGAAGGYFWGFLFSRLVLFLGGLLAELFIWQVLDDSGGRCHDFAYCFLIQIFWRFLCAFRRNDRKIELSLRNKNSWEVKSPVFDWDGYNKSLYGRNRPLWLKTFAQAFAFKSRSQKDMIKNWLENHPNCLRAGRWRQETCLRVY